MTIRQSKKSVRKVVQCMLRGNKDETAAWGLILENRGLGKNIIFRWGRGGGGFGFQTKTCTQVDEHCPGTL
jgi:hypothetical protein